MITEIEVSKILFAGGHDLVREALTDYLRRQSGFEVLQTKNVEAASELYDKEGPFDLVLLGCLGTDNKALDGLSRMRSQYGCSVAILSTKTTSEAAQRALDAGASGFLPKSLKPEDMVAAMRIMLSGEIFSPDAYLTENAPAGAVQLTPRERDVLQGLVAGKLNKEIARDLDIQEVTVKLHVKTLSRKLSAKNRTHAAMLARDMGLV